MTARQPLGGNGASRGAGIGAPSTQPSAQTSGSSVTQDPWALASSSAYDPDTVYTRASDAHGHSQVMHIKVSPSLYHEIQALVQGKEIPGLRTYADVVRDALIHRMVTYREMLQNKGANPGTIDQTIEVEVRAAKLDEMNRRQGEWDNLITKLDQQLQHCLSVGDYDTAWWLVDSNQDPAGMTEPYMKRLSEVLDRHTRTLNSQASRLPVVEDVPYEREDDGAIVTTIKPGTIRPGRNKNAKKASSKRTRRTTHRRNA